MDSAALEKLYKECRMHIRGIRVPSHYTVFLSELAVTLIDKICNVAFLQERFDDAVVHLRDAIEAATVGGCHRPPVATNQLMYCCSTFRPC